VLKDSENFLLFQDSDFSFAHLSGGGGGGSDIAAQTLLKAKTILTTYLKLQF
jgi:hypothetical protein